MIFFRSRRNFAGTPRSAGTLRSAGAVRDIALATLLAYPCGALLRALGPDTLVVQGGGFLLIVLSLTGLAAVATTRLSRITSEEPGQLDEYERTLRADALNKSYQLVGALVLVGIIYLAIASDKGWWIPTGYEQWSGLFWGVFLYVSVIPSAVLSFRLRDEEDGM